MEADFPYARSIVVIRSTRTLKKSGATHQENRFYLSSLEPAERTPAQWQKHIRGHWGGVENRNHWRRDALFGEDCSRSRHPRLLANLALLRTALLRVIERKFPDHSIPSLFEFLSANPDLAFAALAKW